jgi:hypothetical protein
MGLGRANRQIIEAMDPAVKNKSQCFAIMKAGTDENRYFEISGRRAALFRPLGSMDFAIWKVGHERLGPEQQSIQRELPPSGCCSIGV